MKKTFSKIASIAIASSMLLAAVPVNADTTYNADALQAAIASKLDGYNAETKTASLVLDADTDVRKDGNGAYGDGYITATTTKAKSASLKGDFLSTLDMSKVRSAFAAYQEAANENIPAELQTALSVVPVTGQFVIGVVYDARMEMSDETINYHKTVGSMNGFNEEAKRIFKDTKREIKDGAVMADGTVKATDGYKTLLITVDVKAPEAAYASALKTGDYVNKLCYADLAEHAEDLLGDISYTVDDVTVTKAANEDVPQYYTVSISMAGEIMIGAGLSTIEFSAKQLKDNEDDYKGVQEWQEISATMAIKKTSTGGGGGGGSTTATTPKPTVVATATPEAGATATPIPGEATADPNATMDPATPSSTIPPYTPADNKVPSVLNGDDHFVYIIGYPEGDVRPEGNITREEVATIFYRILKDEYRDTVYTKNHNYTDVELSRWSNKAIATLTNGGFLHGYGDDANTFKPASDMTRLEFIVMATNFLDESDSEVKYLDDVKFTDVPERLSWGQEALQKAAIAELIDEDERTDFRPEDKIKRHEAMKIINRLLVRNVKSEGLIDGYVQWPDNSPEAKYYYEVIEATNSHTFERLEDGYEKWTSVNQNWIWGDFKTKYEDPDAEDLK